MEVDYSNHRMINWKWIDMYRNRLGHETFDKFLDMIYGWLMDLKPGQSLDIANHPKITDRNRDLVIKICDLFISEGNMYYDFNQNCTTIKNNNYVSRIRKTETSKGLEKQRQGISV